MIIGCILLALILSIAIYRKHVESNIIFHSFNEPVNIKVGTKLEETPIEFYHTENIDGNKVTHEYIYDQDIVNAGSTGNCKSTLSNHLLLQILMSY